MKNWLVIVLSIIIGSCSPNIPPNPQPSQPTAEISTVWHAASGQFVGSLDFGVLEPKGNKLLTVKVVNDGDTTLQGPPQVSSPDFLLAYHNCPTLAPGKSCQIKVSFSAVGKSSTVYEGSLSLGVATAELSAGVNIPLPETALQVLVNNIPALEEEVVDFGTFKYNQSVLKTLTFKNSGNTIINEAVVVSPPFLKVYDQCSNKPLPVGGSCQVKVNLAGTNNSGLISGSLVYDPIELSLSGTVKSLVEVTEELSDLKLIWNNQVSTETLDLGTVNLQTTKIINLFVKNEGAGAGLVDNLIFPDFLQIISNGCLGKTLIPGGNCSIKGVLKTTARDVYTEVLTLNNQDYSLSYIVRSPGDKIDCHAGLNLVETANITWNGNSYSGCTVEQCQTGAHISNNECLPDSFSISVSPLAEGTGTINGPTSVPYGGSANFNYFPGDGYSLLSWGGDCAGTPLNEDCVIHNITSPKNISVQLETLPHNISVSYAPLLADSQPNQCTPVTLSFTDINGQVVNNSFDQDLRMMLVNNTDLVGYSDSNCTSPLPAMSNNTMYTFSLAAHTTQKTIYIKSNANEGLKTIHWQIVTTPQTTLSQVRNYVYPVSCLDALNKKYYSGTNESLGDGTYTIKPAGQSSYSVLCNQNIAGGGWTRVYKTNFSATYLQNWATSVVVDPAVATPYVNYVILPTSEIMVKTDWILSNGSQGGVTPDLESPGYFFFNNGTNMGTGKTMAQLMSGTQLPSLAHSVWTYNASREITPIPACFPHSGENCHSNLTYRSSLYFNVFQSNSNCYYGGTHMSMFPALYSAYGGYSGRGLSISRYNQTGVHQCSEPIVTVYPQTANPKAGLEIYVK